MPITRRALLGLLSSSTYFLTAAARPLAALPDAEPLTAATFPQGVASGDPQPHAIMLWTRAVPLTATESDAHLVVELSRDEAFAEVLLSSPVSCSAASDYTLRSYVDGLAADTRYYYRFRGSRGSVSRTGRTRTAPATDSAKRANIAFASCQSYQHGHFGAWAHMVAADQAAAEEEKIDFVLHLGDFIYERMWHTRVDGSPLARKVPPLPDGVAAEKYAYADSLADYRHLYKTYLEDPHLQEARARWPFVCTWDDHEYTNNSHQSYATYSAEHVLNPARKQRANQAWFEFIPAVLDELVNQPAQSFRRQALGGDEVADNRAALDSLCIYRKLRWGKHLDLLLTDTRSYRSAPCVDPHLAESLGLPLNTLRLLEIASGGREYDNGNPPDTLPYGDGSTPNPALSREAGTMLGIKQRDWFLDTLQASRATWKVWGNAIPILPMRMDLSTLPFSGYEDSVVNIDGWEGYPHEYRTLMGALTERRISGLVSLSGDHHMHGAATLSPSIPDPGSPAVAADFAVAGISSAPVLEDLMAAARRNPGTFASVVFADENGQHIPVWNMTMLDGVRAGLLYAASGLKKLARWLGPNSANRGLKFVDVSANGYALARFDAGELSVRMIGLRDCRPAFKQPPAMRYTASFRLPSWQAGGGPILEGPQFEGTPPFPFDHKAV